MAKANPGTIVLKGDPQGREALAGASVTPGMLLEVNTSGRVVPHSVAGGVGSAAFAREMDIVGGSIDDVYDSGDTVLYSEFRKGDMAYALLAAGNDVAVGADLESDGAGAFQVVNSSSATRASVVIGAADAAVQFTANQAGIAGNDIQIEYLAATAAAATITVTGNLIQIKPDSTTPGTTDQANDIVTLVNGDAEASGLVFAEATGTGADAVVTPVAATNLTGGTETTGHALVRAMEAVDNDPGTGGAAVRIKVEVL